MELVKFKRGMFCDIFKLNKQMNLLSSAMVGCIDHLNFESKIFHLFIIPPIEQGLKDSTDSKVFISVINMINEKYKTYNIQIYINFCGEVLCTENSNNYPGIFLEIFTEITWQIYIFTDII